MDYGMIGKLEKAKRYAKEPNRFRFSKFTVSMKGENNTHEVNYDEGKWHCTCDFFQTRGRCSHTISLEMILEGMVVPGEAA